MVSYKTNINNFGISCDVKFNYDNYFKSITENLNNDKLDVGNIKNDKSYYNQKTALACALDNPAIMDFSASEYHQYISENSNLISSNLGDMSAFFRNYLNKYLNSFITFKTGVMFDKQHNIKISKPIMFMKPVLRFFENYKSSKMSFLFNFSKFIKLKEKEPHNKIFELPELKKLDKIINSPCLFLTFTMGSDKPLETVLKYKDGWKRFYNNLRVLFKSLGFNMDYFIKGVEFTKNNRLHIHLLVLDVNIEPLKLIKLKKEIEHFLKLANFGYVNDITYIKNDKTYLLKSKTDLLKLKEKNNKNKRFKNIKVLKSFKLDYEGGVSLFNLIEANYIHKKEFRENNASKIINYVLKYILKSTPYDKLEKESEKNLFLKNNILFWLTGVKKFNISRKLSKLLNTFDDVINEKRFYFFNSNDDLKRFLDKDFKNISKTVFDRAFISADDAGRLCDEYKYTASGLYASLSLPVPDFLLHLRFKNFLDFFIFDDGANILNVGGKNGI